MKLQSQLKKKKLVAEAVSNRTTLDVTGQKALEAVTLLPRAGICSFSRFYCFPLLGNLTLQSFGWFIFTHVCYFESARVLLPIKPTTLFLRPPRPPHPPPQPPAPYSSASHPLHKEQLLQLLHVLPIPCYPLPCPLFTPFPRPLGPLCSRYSLCSCGNCCTHHSPGPPASPPFPRPSASQAPYCKNCMME